jgi:hypothetical protein
MGNSRLVANLGVHGFWHRHVKIVKAQKNIPTIIINHIDTFFSHPKSRYQKTDIFTSYRYRQDTKCNIIIHLLRPGHTWKNPLESCMLAELQFLWSNKKLTTFYSHHVGTDGLWTTDTDFQFSAGVLVCRQIQLRNYLNSLAWTQKMGTSQIGWISIREWTRGQEQELMWARP